MAEGGHPWMDDEEGDENFDMLPFHFMAPFVAGLKKEGDERFRAKDYQKAASIYLMALNFPVPPFLNVSVIYEQLFRRRAQCLFKLGKYFEAIEDCERAIEIADCNNSRKLVKSLFIKMKAIQCLGDYVPALLLAVWCKHLKPCQKTKKALNELKEKLREEIKEDDALTDEVLLKMIRFAMQMQQNRETLELALECYTELLDLLDFMFNLPGVLLKRAECLLILRRHSEAKDDCIKAMWLSPGDQNALELMHRITQSLREMEERKPKETGKQNVIDQHVSDVDTKHSTAQGQSQPPVLFEVQSQASLLTGRNRENEPNHDVDLVSGDEKQCVQGKGDNSVSAAVDVLKEVAAAEQTEDVAAKMDAKREKKIKQNKQKKKRKKEKKKKKKEEQQKKESASNQPTMSNTKTTSAELSTDEDESLETDSVVEEPDLCLGYSDGFSKDGKASFAKLSSTFKASVLSEDEDLLADGFIPVKYPRRSYNSKAAKPTEVAPDSDNQFRDQLSHRSLDTAETPRQGGAVTSQPTLKQNTVPQNQKMYPSVTPQMQENVSRSEVDSTDASSWLLSEGFSPRMANVSPQMPIHSSINASGVARSNFKPRDEIKNPTKPSFSSTLQGSQSEDSTWKSSTDALAPVSSQGIPGHPRSSSITGSAHSSSKTTESSKCSSIPVSQSFQTNLTARNSTDDQAQKLSDPNKIPEGVFVVCDHFLQENRQRLPSIFAKTKTCRTCENLNTLKYAVWNKNRHYWQEMRPYPAFKIPLKVTLDMCRHYLAHKPCIKEPCTFPHGRLESTMWTMERQGVLSTPQESLATQRLQSASIGETSKAHLKVLDKDALQTHPGVFSISNLEDFPSLGAGTGTTRITTSPAWTTRTDAPGRSLNQVLPSAKPTIMPPQMSEVKAASASQTSTTDASKNAFPNNPTRPKKSSQMPHASVVFTERFPTVNSNNANSSAWTKPPNPSGRSTPALPLDNSPIIASQMVKGSSVSSMNPGAERSANTFSNPRKIPKGVFVVCDDFLQKNLKRAASIAEKIKACKGCENRSKLRYAVWNDKSKQWQIIRPYPEKVPAKVAFSECRQHIMNIPCLRTPCSFAHGQEELLMWTLEREGVLPTPRETLLGLPGNVTAETSTQPPTQLRYRPSPPGVTNGAYKLCRSLHTRERCRFGRGCIYAHSPEEMKEWEQEYQRKERERRIKELQDKEELDSMEMASKILRGPAEDLVEHLPGVEITCTPPELSVRLQGNNDTHTFQWTFNLTFKTNEIGRLRHVLLLHRYHNCYQLSEIRVGCYQESRECESYKLCYTAKLKESWYKAPDDNDLSGRAKVSLTVSFKSSLYGSFDQCVVFDFGKKPYLMQKLNADVHSESLSQSDIVSQHPTAAAIWDESSVEVVRFIRGTDEALQGEHLSRTYSLPKQVDITDNELNRDNYKRIMHQLLFVEEGFMKDEISRYTLNNTQLHAKWNIFDEMKGMKCAVDNELFGVLYLQEEDALRPDDAAGRLLYRNVSSVWLQLANSVSNKVYEAPVEKVESECVVLRLSSKMCSDLQLYDTCDVSVDAQFQLNRWPLCEMHAAVDRLTTGQLRLIFPESRVVAVRSVVKIRWQWLLDKRLNENQRTVIKQIASPEYNSPPLVVFGPFGTGKTFTLNQAVRLLVQLDKSHRILLCTHSNRAADIHVEHLHKYLNERNGVPAARPLRVYQPMRRLETASEIARNYCLIKDGIFMLPTRDDLVEHRVVVTTLSTSQVLLDLQVFHGFFTHILIDEAAQALEPEALTPLIFAGPNTKVVFTGDHMQMSPEVYSPEARRLGLQKSLAERLFDLYDKDKPEVTKVPNVLFLTENYRSHKDILQFPSKNFYGGKLLACGHTSQPAHPKYGPLMFFAARGKEQKEHDNSYINLAEVYEVVKRVKEVANSWPAIWGPKKLSEIAVLSSYRFQVQAIRNSLRKEKDLKDVKVDTIHNVQGEEFRVLFISTVRTFHTCKPQQDEVRASGSDRQLYWEFLSDPKLLNTAVTRARCLVAVVGDPVSLCTVGECRSIWRDYIKRCDKKGNLYGTTMVELDKEINAAIASIQLNPEAQPFLPESLSTPEQGTGADMNESKKSPSNQESVKETKEVQPVGPVKQLEGNGIASNCSQDSSGKVKEEDKQDLTDLPRTCNMDQNKEEQEKQKVKGVEEDDEEEADDGIAETGDFQDDLLEDETVFPRYLDEIILAFVKKCEETLQLDAERRSMFQDVEFPPLEASKSKDIKPKPDEKGGKFSFSGGGDIKDLFPEVRVVNGRIEVRLTNLGFYKSPSERAQRIIASTNQQEFLDPSVLRQLLKDEPHKYIVCNLRLSPEKSQVGYAQIEDTQTPDIQIKGRVRQAFDKDKVVVELEEKRIRSKVDDGEARVQGRVVGVLEHIISPHERQFVCTTDYENPALMVPINKSATKLVNLTDRSCKDIPIYKKDQNKRATKVKMMKREKVLNGKYLFLVKYLQWRREFTNPLGIVVKTMRRGEDLKSSMEIAYAEHGIRRVFKEETIKYVKEKFPPEWSIPEKEYANRTKIANAVTIDPRKSLDLDDALTIERSSPSTFLVGVHIADVSFFVKPNSPLDHEAFLRCTSYYSGEGQENAPMLPRELSEGHCSLLPDEDRLTISVFVTLDEEGRMSDGPNIKRTIVKSCCRLSYTEAQMIIEKKDMSTAQISEVVMEKIRQLSFLAQNRRLRRLGDRAFDHWQNEGCDEFIEAHELVEEMMLLANEQIAKLLSEKCSELAPLRVQLPPKDHRLAEWIEMHGKYAKLSLQFAGIFQEKASDRTALTMLHSEKTIFKIQRSVWDAICQAVDSGDLPRAHQLICNERNHPQVAAAQSHFRRIQSESRYVCEGDQPPMNIQHYSLGMRSYTHFTSPIRRYIDVVVHRLLLGLHTSCPEENVSKDDVAKVCRRSNFVRDNARKFERDCKRIRLATQLRQHCHETRVFIESIEHQSLSLNITNPEDDQLAGRQKKILLSHLNPIVLNEIDGNEDEEKSIVLRWKFRKYVAPDAQRNITEEDRQTDYSRVGEVVDIPSGIWLRVLDAVRSNNEDTLTAVIKQTEAQLATMSPSHRDEELPRPKSTDYAQGGLYKHPHHAEASASSSSDTVVHFYEKSLRLKNYDYFSVQLSPHMTRGILQPDIQLFKINTHLNICLEHRKYPRESFAHTARQQASREHYGTIDEYINTWKPVLAMEAATEAVRENDGFVIEELNVVWEQDDGSVNGVVTLPSIYCTSRQLEFHLGDLACIRVPYPKTDSTCDETSDKEKQLSSDHSVEQQRVCDFWVAHCIIKEVTYKKEKKTMEIKLALHQAASNIPEGLTDGSSHRSALELIHRTLPQRRMYAALCSKLKDSSELVHAICKGEEPPNKKFSNEPFSNLSLEQHGFKRLNQYQETAVKEALVKPFTLIQGPPGTGKTITGVHIANWFAERNKRLKSYKVWEKDAGETEIEGAYKAPPQVIYCGPSNKSVDVVTEYLMKISSLKVLRVYSDQIEQKEFPIPNKLKPARITRSGDELKISSEKIRSVALHHVIRGPGCPYGHELLQFEEGFAEDRARGEIISQNEVKDYCKLIAQAEQWALQRSGAQIILCTCATAGSPRIVTSCDNMQQCIVDECGMCMEPESLVPITCSGARQVVLIGDHKQLQPVIQDHVAKTLGLSVSMFERHSKRALMLKLQYRMHDGICEFPSRQFYDGKLQTANVVKSRGPSPVSFWPALVRRNRNLPIVFCHVEGQEESVAITTSESNEDSKRNMKEVRKVVQVAKYLVNHYKVRMSDVVILTPYREQRSKISELLKGAYEDIQVTTVIKSQGSEWDYVIISLVRSLKKDEIDPEPPQSWLGEHLGFLRDEHQINVGLTRARRGLCVIGNKHLLGMDEMWKQLLEHYEENNCLVDETWPWS